MLLSLAPRGSFAAMDGDRIVGTSMAIDYGGFGWIARMLVDPAYRGRGLGRALLEAALNALPPEREVRLDATPLGRPLYESYGFTEEALLSRHVAQPSMRQPRDAGLHGVHPLTRDDINLVADHDQRIFGGQRRAVLEWALSRSSHSARIVLDDHGVAGYCFGRQGRLFDQIGPVVARDDRVARQLVSSAMLRAGERPVAVDAFDDRAVFARWLGDCGFRVERPLFRMTKRVAATSSPRRGRDEGTLCEFAIFGPEFA